ncbi:MAG: MFS transporter [Verrucomicrobia bacterium]|nr:MAG: MFS transporter [Verrucomicrobiota bacterium]
MTTSTTTGSAKRYLLRNSLVAALGGLLFGFDTAVISGANEALRALWSLSDAQLGFTVASALIGTIIGSIAVGWPTDRIGRREMLKVLGVLYFVSAVGSALAWDWYSFLFFRFIGGLGVGGASVVSPMYIAEISPARVRGRLVALAQLNIVAGILLAFLSNYSITLLDLGAVEWRWKFGVEAFPAAAFFLLLFGTPRSPRWLMAKGREAEARAVLQKINPDPAAVEEELRAIRESLDLEHHQLNEPFYCRKYLKPILLAFMIAFFNQASGINAVLYYAESIFAMAGAGPKMAALQPVILGLANLVFTVLALAVIDHMGRRKLMLVGSIGYILSLGVTTWAFAVHGGEFKAVTDALAALNQARSAGADAATIQQLEAALQAALPAAAAGGRFVLGALIVFIASHAFGQGAVIWVFISEIFPNRVRARGQALGSFTHWVFAALISQTFPMVVGAFGAAAVFGLYTLMMVGQLAWVIWVMPETKGVPLEEIQKKLGID